MIQKDNFFKIVDEGFVYLAEENSDHLVACGPRCVVTSSGEIICSFMVQSGLGINDFKPVTVRSKNGSEWGKPYFLWKEKLEKYSIFGSISIGPNGKIFFFGTRTMIEKKGESFWCEKTQGLKQNEIVYAFSTDDAYTWSDLFTIPMPVPGSAEAPGPMCITKNGSWHACYSPYNTFDPDVVVEKNQVLLLTSRDCGKTWSYTSMLKFRENYAGAAEAWVIELTDGRLLGTCWKLNLRDGTDFPNAYAISYDDGRTWTPALSTGIMGQSTALCKLDNGRALFIYNQRKIQPYGVRIAVVNPSENDFGVEVNQIVYFAEKYSTENLATSHSDWTQFNFGEPSAVVLPDKSILVVLWCIENKHSGIRYIRLKSDYLI